MSSFSLPSAAAVRLSARQVSTSSRAKIGLNFLLRHSLFQRIGFCQDGGGRKASAGGKGLLLSKQGKK